MQIHVQRFEMEGEDPRLAAKAVKLMHRFTEEEIKAKMDIVEQS